MICSRVTPLLTALTVIAGMSGTGCSVSSRPVPAPPVVMNDGDLQQRTVRAVRALHEEGKTTPMKDLAGQLGRRAIQIDLARPRTRALDGVELYELCRESVLVLTVISEASRGHFHGTSASAWVLSEDGIVVTNWHVIDQPDAKTAAVRTFDGRVLPIREVLTADKAADVAIIQVDGDGLVPLPLAPDTPVGAPVAVISHPNYRFYAMTTGIVSRYFQPRGERQPRMAITADFAKGSSGAPILTETGSVAGMVIATESIYYNEEDGDPRNLQMVIKSCATAADIMELIQGP